MERLILGKVRVCHKNLSKLDALKVLLKMLILWLSFSSVTSYLKYNYGSDTIHGVPSCREEQAEFANQYGIRYHSPVQSESRISKA